MSGVFIVRNGKKFGLMAYAGIDPASKRQRRKWLGTYNTRKEAEQARMVFANHPTFTAGMGLYGNPRLRTGDYLDDWLNERRALREMETADHTEMLIRLYLKPTLGHIPLSRLSPLSIQGLYTDLLDRNGRHGSGKRGLSPATVVRAAGVLHAALERAVHRGLIARNPQDNTTMPKVPRYQPTVLTPEQVIVYLTDARKTATPAMFALYMTSAGTGARVGELLGLPEAAIDLNDHLLHVRQDLVQSGSDPIYGAPKTEAGYRTILLPETVMSAIRGALVWKKQQKLLRARGARYRDSGLLFTGEFGRPLNPSNIRIRDHYPRLERLGLPRTRLYDLRHFHVTFLVAEGVDYRTVADRVGHKSPKFTISRYAHASYQAQVRAVAVTDDLLTKVNPSAR